MMQSQISTEARVKSLRRAIDQKGLVRIIEAHSGLSAIVGERAQVIRGAGSIEYDGLWESSLTDSATKGFPDAEILGPESRLHTINEILEVTGKPVIVDGDTGRTSIEFQLLVRRLERLGVSAVIIEDKIYPKRNSLDPGANQTLEDPAVFAQKIASGHKAKTAGEFLIIARIESLIAGTGLQDALKRAEAYIRAGVDGIMIHSQKDKPDEILQFADSYPGLCRRLGRKPVLVCVPTTYNLITDSELGDHGFNVVIHANHLLRSAYKAMTAAAGLILESDRSFEAGSLCARTSEIFQAVGFEKIKEQDRENSAAQRLSVIIPAAGRDPIFEESPKSLIQVAGKSILDRQLESLKAAGLTNNRVTIVRGHRGEEFTRTDVDYVDNPRFMETHSLHSLFCAEPAMREGFLLVYSDLLFDREIVRRLVTSGGDIVLAIDHSYRYHKHDVDKKLDLVVSGRRHMDATRRLQPDRLVDVFRIGKQIPKEMADYEYVGIAYFSEQGADVLRKVYAESRTISNGKFHEADNLDRALVTDLIQEVIDRGFKVHGVEVSMGWIEIHSRADVKLAEQELTSLSGVDSQLAAGRRP